MRPRDRLSLLLPAAYVGLRFLTARIGRPETAAALGPAVSIVFLLALTRLRSVLADNDHPAHAGPPSPLVSGRPVLRGLIVLLAAAAYSAAVRLAVPGGAAAPGSLPVLADVWLLGPVVEEALYRGCLYRTLRRIAPAAAVFFSTALFAAAHGSAIQALLSVPFSLMSVTALELTGSLRTCAALHCGYNLAADLLAGAGISGVPALALSAGSGLLCVILCFSDVFPASHSFR